MAWEVGHTPQMRSTIWVAPFQNLFKTAEHPTGEVGVHNLAVLHHHLGLEMALDSGDGIDGDSGLGHKALL